MADTIPIGKRQSIRACGYDEFWLQDQIVDVWSDNRLAAGGVGFFSDKGEQAKIRWIEVTHQSDFLGKLCAYLVPYDTRSANRSMTQ